MNATTMKQSFPIKFGDTAVPFPLTWEEQHNNITTVNMTEDGKDHVTFTRKDKLRVSASWKCSNEWASLFRSRSKDEYFTLYIYDHLADDYVLHVVRITEFSCNLIKHSWNIYYSYGLWEVNMTIEEY